MVDPVTRKLNLDSDAITENTRGSYPIDFIRNTVADGCGGQPKNVFFLTADAFGTLPPISRLTPEQAMYHFISGYTAKLAGTERGVAEPQATFSACFGAPFLPMHPFEYARFLKQRIERHGVDVWLVNTGWTEGPYGVGHRMSLAHTRALLRAALDGSLSEVATTPDPVFGLHVPVKCPGVPTEILQPARPGPTGRRTTRKPRVWPGCSARTSSSMPITWRPRSWQRDPKEGLIGTVSQARRVPASCPLPV